MIHCQYFHEFSLPHRIKNAHDVVDAFNVDPLYLRHDHQGQQPDYRVGAQGESEISISL